MTAENEGTGATPEGDDPFAYLYRQQGGDGSSAPQPGTPRRSYNQVRTVGERQYGSQYSSQYGASHTQQTTYGQQPNAHYAAPETMPGGRAATTGPIHGSGNGYGGHGSGGGRSRNGLLVGAIAVVAAVVIGIGAAIYFNSGSPDGGQAGDSSSATGGDSKGNGQKPGAGKVRKGKTIGKKQDAASLSLAGGAAVASDVPNAQGRNGTYVGAMNAGGASAAWTVDNVPKAGAYTLFVRYGVPGQDADSTLTVNGQPRQQPLNMSNFGNAQKGDWAKGWTQTYAYVDLKPGQNSFKISCEQGNKCDFNLDQVWLKAGKLKN
ncbi:MAG TPA: hypothetical protein VGO89_21680 [Streptomyces sp.]|nr:hypothetical protein [Streptomyces sp.]